MKQIERLVETMGQLAAGLIVPMIAITFSVAVLRYGFNIGWVWLQELYVWLNAAVFLLAAGWGLSRDQHVCIDVLSRRAGPRGRAWIDVIGAFGFLLPAAGVLLWHFVPYVMRSWSRLETSREAGGLPGLFLFKTLMIVFAVLIALAGLRQGLRALAKLTGREGG